MKLRHLLGAFLAASLVLSAATVWLASELQGALERVARTETQRFKSISLADELRQSSDDLTRFARMYVQTGDERFVDYFDRVLAIRNGERLRPDQYEGVYWDLVIYNPGLLDESSGEAASLQDRMKLLGFSEAEFGLLAQAQKRSDELTAIENRAFNAMRGRFDDGTGKHTVAREPDRALAQGLLHGEAYHQAKASIMEPIGRFQRQVNIRTAAALDDVRRDADALLFGTFASAGSLLALLTVLALLVHRRVVRRTGALAGAAEQIAAGNLKARSGVRGSDELGTLGTTFDEMVSRLAETLALVTAAKDRMEEELNIGRDIQMSMVPLTFPAFPEHDEFAIFATLKPAREVGGDFYDFFFIDDDHLCFCVGDVSGKGVPAALFMAVTRTLVRAHATGDRSPATILTRVNEVLSADNPSCMFVTLFLGVLDVRSGECLYTNAGHNPPYCVGPQGVEALAGRHGPVVGVMEGLNYEEGQRRLSGGETLVVFTDGVTEAMNPADELLGEPRLAARLAQRTAVAVPELVDRVVRLVDEFEAGTDQSDDVTVLALRFNGAEAQVDGGSS